MTRNLKVLGLAVFAVLALSAVAAATASATEYHHFEGTKGAQLSAAGVSEYQVFESTTGEGSGYKCKKVSVVNSEVEAATATEVTAEPKYDECKAFKEGSEFAATVKVNGCHYLFTSTTTPGNPTGGEHANVHLQCPEGEEIEIRVTAFQFKCAAVPPQEIKHAVRYENETTPNGETHVLVIATAHGIRSTTVESIAGCGSEEHTNGNYTGEVTVTAPGGVSVKKNATTEQEHTEHQAATEG